MSTVTEPAAPSVPPAPLDLSTPRRLHVIGAAGPGMSAIASALAEMGHHVSGVDIRERQVLDRLRAAGVTVHIGHHRSHVVGCDAVTASTAIAPDLNELDEARKLGITVLSRAGMLASICAQAKSLGVAGTHGKTTTTSMLMLILADAGLRPSFVIGGDVTDMGTGAQWTGGEWFVVEADESDGTHLELPLHGTILTNIDLDHLDHYGSIEAIEAGFDRYLAQIPGPKVVCADNPRSARVAARHDVVTYGMHESADVRAVRVRADSGSFQFDIERAGTVLASVDLPLRGEHNVVNATGAVAMATEVGVDPQVAAEALSRFGGVARRFDVRGHDGGATFVDDYAHLPTEIDAVLRAARRQRRWMAPHDRRVPAQPVQPHGGDVAGVRRRLPGGRSGGSDRYLSVGNATDPGGHWQARGECGVGCGSSDACRLAAAPRRPRRLPRRRGG